MYNGRDESTGNKGRGQAVHDLIQRRAQWRADRQDTGGSYRQGRPLRNLPGLAVSVPPWSLGLSKAALPCTGEVYQLPSSSLKQNTQQKQFKKRKAYLGLEFQEIGSIMAKTWWQEHKAPGHALSPISTQRAVNVDTQRAFSFYLVWDPSPWNGTTSI